MCDKCVYPDRFIHGVANENNIEDNIPTVEYLSRFRENAERKDSEYSELSINWYDCDAALEKIFEQRNSDGNFKFQYGAILLLTNELENLTKKPQIRHILKYERYPLDDNIYHGNLLLLKTAQKLQKFMVASGLILNCISEIKPRVE